MAPHRACELRTSSIFSNIKSLQDLEDACMRSVHSRLKETNQEEMHLRYRRLTSSGRSSSENDEVTVKEKGIEEQEEEEEETSSSSDIFNAIQDPKILSFLADVMNKNFAILYCQPCHQSEEDHSILHRFFVCGLVERETLGPMLARRLQKAGFLTIEEQLRSEKVPRIKLRKPSTAKISGEQDACGSPAADALLSDTEKGLRQLLLEPGLPWHQVEGAAESIPQGKAYDCIADDTGVPVQWRVIDTSEEKELEILARIPKQIEDSTELMSDEIVALLRSHGLHGPRLRRICAHAELLIAVWPDIGLKRRSAEQGKKKNLPQVSSSSSAMPELDLRSQLDSWSGHETESDDSESLAISTDDAAAVNKMACDAILSSLIEHHSQFVTEAELSKLEKPHETQ